MWDQMGCVRQKMDACMHVILFSSLRSNGQPETRCLLIPSCIPSCIYLEEASTEDGENDERAVFFKQFQERQGVDLCCVELLFLPRNLERMGAVGECGAPACSVCLCEG